MQWGKRNRNASSFHFIEDLSTNSFFQTIDNSYYGYLYYHIYSIRENIKKFVYDDKYKKYLSTASTKESQFNDGENFCIYSTFGFVSGYYGTEFSTSQTYLSKVSQVVEQCRKIGNGLNLSGYTVALDLMLQQLNYLYYTFKVSDHSTRQLSFLQSEDLTVLENNIINQVINLQYANAYITRDDILHTYQVIHKTKLIFSVISICFSCLVITFIMIITITTMEGYNFSMKDFIESLQGSFNNYS